MGFMDRTFDTAKAVYMLWTGLGAPGFFSVTVEGQAPNYTSGIQLVRDAQWVGGLAIKVMGWTGPLGKGTKPARFRGPSRLLPQGDRDHRQQRRTRSSRSRRFRSPLTRNSPRTPTRWCNGVDLHDTAALT